MADTRIGPTKGASPKPYDKQKLEAFWQWYKTTYGFLPFVGSKLATGGDTLSNYPWLKPVWEYFSEEYDRQVSESQRLSEDQQYQAKRADAINSPENLRQVNEAKRITEQNERWGILPTTIEGRDGRRFPVQWQHYAQIPLKDAYGEVQNIEIFMPILPYEITGADIQVLKNNLIYQDATGKFQPLEGEMRQAVSPALDDVDLFQSNVYVQMAQTFSSQFPLSGEQENFLAEAALQKIMGKTVPQELIGAELTKIKQYPGYPGKIGGEYAGQAPASWYGNGPLNDFQGMTLPQTKEGISQYLQANYDQYSQLKARQQAEVDVPMAGQDQWSRLTTNAYEDLRYKYGKMLSGELPEDLSAPVLSEAERQNIEDREPPPPQPTPQEIEAKNKAAETQKLAEETRKQADDYWQQLVKRSMTPQRVFKL